MCVSRDCGVSTYISHVTFLTTCLIVLSCFYRHTSSRIDSETCSKELIINGIEEKLAKNSFPSWVKSVPKWMASDVLSIHECGCLLVANCDMTKPLYLYILRSD